MEGIFLIWILQALVMATIPAMIADSKGRDVVGWFFYGFLIWPIALVHALLISPADSVVCRFCTKHISREAKVCPYCQRELANGRERKNTGKNNLHHMKENDSESDLLILPEVYRSRGQPMQKSARLRNSKNKEEIGTTDRKLTARDEREIQYFVLLICALVGGSLLYMIISALRGV